MGYVIYIAATLVLLGLCVYKLAELGKADLTGKARRMARSGKETPEQADNEAAPGSLRQAEEVLQRERLKVPTPWGWPGNPNTHEAHYVQGHVAGNAAVSSEGSAALHRWVDHLVSSKQTTDNREYLLRRDSSMRALLEDRFVSPRKMTEIKYQKTKPLRLRDPSAAHDQMDNFPAGRIDRIEARLRDSTGDGTDRKRKIETIVFQEAPALKSPWGW